MSHINFYLRSSLLSFVVSSALIACFANAVRAQSALDGFDPNANGTVFVVVVQPDGKILIGGDFTSLAPNGGASVTRNRIARLNADGTLDTGFNPNANGIVFSIAVQADGRILAGGSFTTIGGQTRNRIARLNAISGLADSFDPNANGSVRLIVLQPDGKILVGGLFNGANSIGGQTRNRIARLDATTGAADSWDPNASSELYAIVVQQDGNILIGGIFTSVGGQPRNRIARLDAVTGLADSFDPNSNSTVTSIAVQADGKILAGGIFTTIGGQTRNSIARLDAGTGSADSFNPNANGSVIEIAVQADGKILVSGNFTTISGAMRNRIVRLSPTTGAADPFDPNADGQINSIAIQPDGKILVSGFFTTLAPNGGASVARSRIARLETDGGVDQTLDQTLDLGMVGSQVFATAVQSDGKVIIGGLFNTVLGVTRNNIARLNSDGTLDTAFNPNADSIVYSIALQADGKILVGGAFTNIGGQERNRIARLDATTGAADSFNPNSNDDVNSIAVQADGKVLVGGSFRLALGTPTIGGQTRNKIARLDPVTGLADSWNPNASHEVMSIVVQSDGKILVGGFFNGANSIGGQTRNRIARLNPATGAAESFNPNADGFSVNSLAVQADGKILVGGDFGTIGGQTRSSIARLNPVTGLADSFDPNANGPVFSIAVQADGKVLAGGLFSGANSIGGQSRNRIARLDAVTGLADSFDPNADSVVNAIAVQADGKVLVGGAFAGDNSIGGQTRNRFARLKNDTIATQNLTVTQTTVTWTRGGSSPQLSRVTFEDSTDGVNYNFLGHGTATGSNWTLTGLNLSIQQNLYIRARGHYRSGISNGSDSIQESVRNAFIVPPPMISGTVTYGNAIGAPTPRFVSNVLITGAGSPAVMTTTAAPGGTAGQYSLSGFGSGSYTVTPTKTGGVNGISSFDAARIAQHVSGSSILTGNALIVADVSGNGIVSSFDAAQIAAFVSSGGGMQTGTWKFIPVNRTYASVTSSIAGQDFIALLMGEVSGNWNNTGARPVDSSR